MGFPKGVSLPFAKITIGAGVKTPDAKWCLLFDSIIGRFLGNEDIVYMAFAQRR